MQMYAGPMLSLLEFLRLQKVLFCNTTNTHGSARSSPNLLITTDGSSLSPAGTCELRTGTEGYAAYIQVHNMGLS